MIISQLNYRYDPRQVEDSRPLPDKSFLLNEFKQQLKNKYKEVSEILKIASDNEWSNLLQKAKIKEISLTGHGSPNTAVTFELPPDGKIRGPFTLMYNRMTLEDYFGFTEIVNDLKRNELVIDYSQWMESIKRGELAKLIHHEITHRFGRTLSGQGIVIVDPAKKDYQGQYPLALIVPHLKAIEQGWLKIKNISDTVPHGTLTHQYLDVRLRVVSHNHLFIEDGELVIKLKLKRPLRHYNPIHEEVEHAD